MPTEKRPLLSRLVELATRLISPRLAYAAKMRESLAYVSTSSDFVAITPTANIDIDLRYASSNNFVGRNIYGEFNRAFLHRIAADMLRRAVINLRFVHPGYRLVIFDALRPASAQWVLWNKVKGTPQEKYIANPKKGSLHSYGFAVDLSIVDEKGNELDMATPFDDFTPLAEPRLEQQLLKEGKLLPIQIENRTLLRKIMGDAGFIPLSFEWWHFDALPGPEVRGKYRIVE